MMTPSGKTPVGQNAMGMVTPSSTGKFSEWKIPSECVHNHFRQITVFDAIICPIGFANYVCRMFILKMFVGYLL